tara:strand:+ start:734 stop:895 length:162 start_codon:yes stop_codon:yes gene_type:complete
MYENFQENLLDKCKQRLLCCDQRIADLADQLRKVKADKLEVLKLQKAIKEINQ